jgi:hypothetical protein
MHQGHVAVPTHASMEPRTAHMDQVRDSAPYAVQLIAKLTRQPGTPPPQGVVLDAADLIGGVEAEQGYTNASMTSCRILPLSPAA